MTWTPNDREDQLINVLQRMKDIFEPTDTEDFPDDEGGDEELDPTLVTQD